MKIKNNILINFTSCDFTKFVYGTEKYILDNIRVLEKNVDVLSIIPFQSKKSKLYSKYNRCFQILINKNEIGIVSFEEITILLKKINENKNINKYITIQNIIEFEFEEIKRVFNLFNGEVIYIHLHDYSLICKSYNLIDSHGKFCYLNKCGSCNYLNEKKALYDFVSELDVNRVIFISPSYYTKKMFCKAYPEFLERTLVISHEKYEYMNQVKDFKKIRLGYIGAQLETKGWNDFKKLALAVDKDFELFYLGHGSEVVEKITNIPVGKDGKFSMIEAIRDNDINIAFLGSIWPETYSYTLFEAMANGCFILCNQRSGNVADMVRELNNGYIYESIDNLIEYLSSNEFKLLRKKNESIYLLNKKVNFYFNDKFPSTFKYIEINYEPHYSIYSKLVKLLRKLK